MAGYNVLMHLRHFNTEVFSETYVIDFLTNSWHSQTQLKIDEIGIAYGYLR
jgi:hypothetical protein